MTRENEEPPIGWAWTTLGEPLTWGSGGTPLRSRVDYYDGDIPWAIIGDMSDGPISKTASCITESGLRHSAAKWVRPGSVLLAMYGSIGKLGINAIPITTNQAIAFTYPEPINAKYLFYYLMYARAELISKGKGGTQSNISQTVIKAFPFVVAPVPEQYRIVEAIESYLTRLNDAAGTLERVRRNLKRYRASVLKSAVEGRLVPSEAELARAEDRSFEQASVLLERILAERRRRWEEAELAKMAANGKATRDDKWKLKYVEPVAPDTAELPELPDGWCWASVDQLERGDRRSAYGVLVPGPDVPMGVAFVRVGDIDGGRIDTSQMKRIARKVADKFAKTYLQGGEVLLTLVGTIGRTAVAPPALAGANVARAVGVIPASDLIDPHWVEYWFRSPMTRYRMIGKAHEVARKTLNLEDVRAACVALPPRREQNRIRESVDHYESIIDSMVEANQDSARRCIRLRQSILKWAFEGRLVDQDQTDEPASVLLERIRSERATVRASTAAVADRRNKSARQSGKARTLKS